MPEQKTTTPEEDLAARRRAEETNRRLRDPHFTTRLRQLGALKEFNTPGAGAIADRAAATDQALAEERAKKLGTLPYGQQLTKAAGRYMGAARAAGEPMTPAIPTDTAEAAIAKASKPVPMAPGEAITPTATPDTRALLPFPPIPAAGERAALPLAKVAGGSK